MNNATVSDSQAATSPAYFDLRELPTVMSAEEFDEMLRKHTPDEVKRRIADTIKEATHLWSIGVADTPPKRSIWVRSMTIAWHHSRDMTTIMGAMGEPKMLTGVHDLSESVLGVHLKSPPANVDPWYTRWIDTLDDAQEVCIGWFNPHLSASFYRRGLNPNGPLNASHAHFLSDHHGGTKDTKVDLVEHGINLLYHGLPREHLGVLQLPLKPWSEAAERMAGANLPAAVMSVIERALPLMQSLEESGSITPWHRCRV